MCSAQCTHALSVWLVIFFSSAFFSQPTRQVEHGGACCQATGQSVWLKLWFPIYHLRDWCVFFFSTDALQSSRDEHSSSIHAKWIFTVKWNIWLLWSWASSSSHNLTWSYTFRMSNSCSQKPGLFVDFWMKVSSPSLLVPPLCTWY